MAYKLPSGLWSEHPISKQQAINDKKPRYHTGELCPDCNIRSVRLTVNDKCTNCARREALTFYYAHSDSVNCIRPYSQTEVNGDYVEYPQEFWDNFDNAQNLLQVDTSYKIVPEPCKKGHVGFWHKGRCVECSNSPRSNSRGKCEKWYTPETSCPKCDTTSLRRVSDNRCQGCNPITKLRSPNRQKALQSGDAWYTPETPCPKCNTVSLKRVSNGQCQGCVPVKPRGESPRAKAVKEGDKWYKPDTPCPNCGTKAARYVANGRCSGCA